MQKNEETNDPFYTKVLLRVVSIIIFGFIILISGAGLLHHHSGKALFVFVIALSGLIISLPNFNKFLKKQFNTTWSSFTKGFILILIFVIILLTTNIFLDPSEVINSQPLVQPNQQPKQPVIENKVPVTITYEKLKAETTLLSNTMVRIVNRNDYSWHNVSITVNDYYSCWEYDVLDSDEGINLEVSGCNQFILNQDYIRKIEINTKENKGTFYP